MDVVIFEDDMDFAHNLEMMVEKVIRTNPGLTMALVTSDFEGLCRYIELLEKPTIFILDIMFGDCAKGFKMADVISKQQLKAVIVFITNYPNKILTNSLYKIKSFNIILKSSRKLEHELALTLIEALKFIEGSNILVYKDKFTTILVEVEGIYYIETINNENKIRIHSKRGVYEVRTSLTKFMKRLPRHFLRCHNSYIVNTTKIVRINSTARSIEMANGGICYYSHRHKKCLDNSIGSSKASSE